MWDRAGTRAARRAIAPALAAGLVALFLAVPGGALSAPGASGSTRGKAASAAIAAAAVAPPVTAGLQLYFDADAEGLANGAAVTTWHDNSGFGRDLSAFSSNQSSTYHTGAVNGHAAVEFDGSSSLLKTYGSTFTINQPDTFFIVYKSLDPSTSTSAFVFDSTNSSVRQVFGRGGANDARVYANNDLFGGGVTYPFAGYEIWAGTFSGSNSSLFRNGNAFASGNAGGSALSGFTVGALSTSGQYGYQYTHSSIAAILVYNGALSASNRQSVTDWLNQRFAISTPPPPTAPANTALPSITGTAHETSTLTGGDGTWSGTAPITFARQWLRCDAAGANCATIAQAAGSTYTVATADVGSTLRFRVAATNAQGNATATSAQTAVVTSASVPPPAQPPITAGLQLYYNADAESYANGAAVTRWRDNSGFGRDLTAFAPNQAGIYRSGALNGHAAVEFDGSSSLLKTYGSTFTINQPDTFFVVYKSLDPDTSARAFVFDSTNSSLRQVFGRGGQGSERMYANNDFDAAGVTYPFAGYDIWSGIFNGSSSTMYRNGALFASGNAGASGLSGLTVGGLSTTGQYGYDYSHSNIAAILVYGGALSASDRQSVTDWLNQLYAVTTPPPPTPPSNVSPPSISGTAHETSVLSGADGTWSGSAPITYTRQWLRCDALTGLTCGPISGAAGSTYTATSADVGSRLKFRVTATNSQGSATANSALTAVVTSASSPPPNQPPVTAGLQLFFDADAETYANGAAVTTWHDNSGFGRNLTAFAAGQAPTYRTGAVNGHAAVEFNGTSSLLKTYGSTFTINQPDTFFIVYKSLDNSATTSEAYIWDSTNSSIRQLLGLGPFHNTEMYADIDIEAPTPYPFPAYQIWSGTFNGAASCGRTERGSPRAMPGTHRCPASRSVRSPRARSTATSTATRSSPRSCSTPVR
jgi:fibronectin-binding autotransporter adhesin